MTGSTQQDDEALAPAVDRLVQLFAGVVPVEVVRTVLEDAFQDLRAAARITTYVPLLAERLADQRLRVLIDETLNGVAVRAEPPARSA
jgi:hypothetical protein